MSDTLFDLPPAVPVPLKVNPRKGQGFKQLRAYRQAQGVHPFNGLPLYQGPEPRRCGQCAHHYTREFAKTYHKCDTVRATGGGGTDILVGWPACERFEEAKQ